MNGSADASTQPHVDPARLERITNIAVNIAIVVLCIFAVGVGIYRFTSPQTPKQPVLVGSRISLPGVTESNKNLVMAVSTTCQYCSASTGFYKQLVPAAAAHHVNVIAVLPQTVQESRAYFTRLGLPADVTFTQDELPNLHVSGTPTLMLVGPTGEVKKVWVGRLPNAKELQVLASL